MIVSSSKIKFCFRFCVGDRFYLCENKILCEYDYEERLVFASMANHPMLKRQANNLSTPGAVSMHGPSPGQHGIIPGHQGVHSAVNGHRSTPQADLNNNNNSHVNNHNSPVPSFGGIGNKSTACNQNPLGTTG